MVIVMPQQTQKAHRTVLVSVDYAHLRDVCMRTLSSVQARTEAAQMELVREEVAQRQKRSTWWRKLFRISVDPQKVKAQLQAMNPLEDDRWVMTQFELRRVNLAVTRMLRAAHPGTNQVAQEDWALVLRGFHKYVR
jgi:hypothetical protein